MSFHSSLRLALILALFTLVGHAPADKPAPPKEPAAPVIPPELIDADFDKFLDMKLLMSAVDKSDAKALTDIGVKLAEGERVVKRPHKSLPAEKILLLATRAAGESHDKETLARLDQAAKELKYEKLAAAVEVGQKLASAARKVDPPVGLDQAAPEVVILYRGFAEQIRTAKTLGSKQQLDSLEKAVRSADEMGEKLKTSLVKQIAEARSAVPEKADPELDVLASLAMASRGITVEVKGASFALHNSLGIIVKYRIVKPGDTGTHSLAPGATHTIPADVAKGEKLTVVLIHPDNKESAYAVEAGRKYTVSKSRTANKHELTTAPK